MGNNPIKALNALGQSVWLDYISRSLLSSGELEGMIERDGLMGMTSNPTIFERAMAHSEDYDDDIRALIPDTKDPLEIYERLSQQDVRRAADIFMPVYQRTNGADGYVSLEVNPHLAYDAQATIDEALRFVNALGRPNIMIKVPATTQGIDAIQALTAQGVSVNATLIFGLSRYDQVAKAYIAGLAARRAAGLDIGRVHSVASFFISRIDASVDEALADIGGDQARALLGRIAVANAKAAHRRHGELFSNKEFSALAQQGGNPQRLLWASTSTKNPAYSDVKYVEELIGAGTVNTIPGETLDRYRDHGNPALRLEEDMAQAHDDLQRLAALGVDIEDIAQFLEDDGVAKFQKSFDDLIAALGHKIAAFL
jgi:transaldolase